MAVAAIERLLRVMRRLRAGDGCEWDRAQTSVSLVPYLLEEAYEVVDAIQRGDRADLRDELGDLLFQIVFHARIAEESGDFDFAAVATAIADKLERRHPHVFGAVPVGGGDDRARALAWEAQKAAERREKDPDGAAGGLAGVAEALPALVRAVKLQNRAARAGFDWQDVERVLDKLEEEIGELKAEIPAADPARLEHEIGDILLAATNLARHLRIDPESALRAANHRFERRYARMEVLAVLAGGRFEDASLEQQEAWWQQAKQDTG